MRILLTERFQREVSKLQEDQRFRCFELILALPKVIGHPHQHTGFSLRKIHRSGIWEARLGLHLRMIFTFANSEVVLVTVGKHDDVRKFLLSL